MSSVRPPQTCLIDSDDLVMLGKCDEQVLTASHRLHLARAFQPHGVSALLNCHPESSLELSPRAGAASPQGRLMRPAPIHPWLQAVHGGHLRFCLQNLLVYHPDIQGAVHGFFDELEVRVKGFRARERRAELWAVPAGDTFTVHNRREIPLIWQITGTTRVQISRDTHSMDAGKMISCPARQSASIHGQADGSLILITYHQRAQDPRATWSARLMSTLACTLPFATWCSPGVAMPSVG